MLSNAARFLMVSAAASLVALGSAPAEAADACVDLSDAAFDLIGDSTLVPSGAVFLTAVQKAAFGYTNTDIAVLWGSTSPNSSQYYDNFFAAQPHFEEIENIAGVDEGDVLIIDATMTYSGHTAIITGPATPAPSGLGPSVDTTLLQWAVPIADSTSSKHGCSASYPDSRCVGNVFTPGEGTAFMRIYTDASGKPVGHTWSVSAASLSNYFPISDTVTGAGAPRPFKIGRLAPCPPL
ncbi:hypothetical protein WME76_09320 [Sorangium sp. So ce119]|uniref:hypothetical protein n=1 Tax=Sorangium sp. So ce119 TaxID=3133279 RepID=UPI003F5F78B1